MQTQYPEKPVLVSQFVNEGEKYSKKKQHTHTQRKANRNRSKQSWSFKNRLYSGTHGYIFRYIYKNTESLRRQVTYM